MCKDLKEHVHKLCGQAAETYAGGSDLEEFEVFVAGILRWLKMNCLLGETSTDMQVDYLGTCLTGKVQEWFYRNVEQYDHQVRN